MLNKMLSKRKEKKGQIFSIDAAIGAFLVGLIVIVAIINITKQAEPESIQTEKIGYDIVAILHYEGKLASVDASSIESRMNEILPQQYGMRLRLEGENFDAFEVGSPIIQRFVASGKRVFINASSDINGIATFWIWLK